MNKFRLFTLCAALLFPMSLGACSSGAGGSPRFAVPPGAYTTAFETTREVLADLEFDLDRLDAASGSSPRPPISRRAFSSHGTARRAPRRMNGKTR
ncbi:MAG: hypothetical protein IPJ41_03275 [Phycisphaerales bacterium]|nr:hypothetical protein [Phycisphaerales bacterium]